MINWVWVAGNPKSSLHLHENFSFKHVIVMITRQKSENFVGEKKGNGSSENVHVNVKLNRDH